MGFKLMCILGLPSVPFSVAFLVISRLIFLKRYHIFTINNQYYGHMALDTEIRLQESKGRKVIAAFRESSSANIALQELIINQIKPFPRILVLPLVSVLQRMPSSVSHYIGYKKWGEYREFPHLHYLGGDSRYLQLTPSQQVNESSILQRFNLEKGNYYCIAIRDGVYHAERSGQEDQSYRNMDFSLFLQVIADASDLPIKFVRLGRKSKNKYDAPNFIDYANSLHKSDLADLVLLKNSLGLINSGDGIGAVATVLNIPILFVNHAPWELLFTFSKKNWIVPSIFEDSNTKEIVKAEKVFSYATLALSSTAFDSRQIQIRLPEVSEIREYCSEFISATLPPPLSCDLYRTQQNDVSYTFAKDATIIFWQNFEICLPKYALKFHRKIRANIPSYFLKKYTHQLFRL